MNTERNKIIETDTEIIIEGNLELTEDFKTNKSLIVKGNIFGKGKVRYNINVSGNLNCWNLNCWNLNCGDLNCNDLNCGDLNCWDVNCRNLNCRDLNCRNLNCGDLNCRDLKCWNLICEDLTFYAVAVAYYSFKCKSWKAKQGNFIIKCLNREIQVEDKNV